MNSSRPISGRSRGIKFACDGTAWFGMCGQDGEAAGSSERAKLSRDDETPSASRTTCPHGTSPRPTRPMCPAAGVPDRNGTVTHSECIRQYSRNITPVRSVSVLSSRLPVVRLVTRSPRNGPIYSDIMSIFLETSARNYRRVPPAPRTDGFENI